jgi:hypothetical protein
MKLRILCLFCGWLLGAGTTQLRAQTNELSPKLVGIVSMSGTNVAWVDITTGDAFRRRRDRFIMSAGERDGEFEVTRIQPESGLVEGQYAGTNLTLKFEKDAFPSSKGLGLAPYTIRSRDAAWEYFVWLYQGMMNRSVLCPARLRDLRFTLDASATNRAEACKLIEQEFRKQGVVPVLDGVKFVQLVSEAQAPNVVAGSANPSTNSLLSASAGGALLDGFVDFRGVLARDAASVYGKIAGFEIHDRYKLAPRAHSACIYFRSQGPLTRLEVLYALETLFRFEGLAVERVDSRSFTLVEIH